MQSKADDQALSYRAYTTKFDRTIQAVELDSVLGPLSLKNQQRLDEAWDEAQTGLLPWRTKVHVASQELSQTLRAQVSEERRKDTVVSLLFDQSGSMRGQKMLYAAATADLAQEFLATLGIACEVLGFTTSQWRGGRSRRRWKWRFMPRAPGRLNDLLHVVFRDAGDNRASTGGWAYRQMLRPDFPKENVDGEAIEWAASRLRTLTQTRKILVILSDGAPVDDSTLSENGPTYLHNHLESVVEDLKSSPDIEIAAFGIGYAAHDFYPVRDSVDDPSELGVGLLTFVTKLLLEGDRAEAKAHSSPE